MHILVAIRISWLWWSYLPRISFLLHLDAIHHFPFNLTLGLGVHNLGRFTRAIIKAMEFPMALFYCICFALRWCSSWPFHCRNRRGKGKGQNSILLWTLFLLLQGWRMGTIASINKAKLPQNLSSFLCLMQESCRLSKVH